MISQSIVAAVAKFVVIGGLMAAGGGGLYFVVTRTSDDAAKQTIVAATETPTAAATAATAAGTATTTPAAGSIFVSDLSQLKHVFAWPAISPDGAKILGRDSDGLKVGPADESDLQTIEPDAVSAIWAPDSLMLAVTVAHGGLSSSLQPADLVLMNADGSSRTPLGKSDFPQYTQY